MAKLPDLEELFKIPEIDTKKSRLQRRGSKNWTASQRQNAKAYGNYYQDSYKTKERLRSEGKLTS